MYVGHLCPASTVLPDPGGLTVMITLLKSETGFHFSDCHPGSAERECGSRAGISTD